MQGVRRDFMDMPECAVQKLFVMRCQMHVWRNLVYSQPRNIFVKRDVKLTEPPDAEPHVRWCERSAAKAVSYSIKPAPLYQGGKYLLCGRRHLSQHVVCTPSVPDRWEFWLCSCSCRDAYPEQERAFPVASGTSGWVERRKSRGMKAQGDITVDFEWREGRIHRVRLCSSHEQKVTLECNGISKTVFLKPDGTENMIFDWSVLRGWNHWQPYHVKAHGTAVFSTWNIL